MDRLDTKQLLELHPWPEEWANAERIERLWVYDLPGTPESFWPFLSDTSRMNRALGTSEMTFTERDGKRFEIPPNPRVAVNDSAAHLASLRAGLGLGQVISFMVSASGARNELVPVLEEWQPEPLPIHVLYPANRHLSSKVRVFIDWAAELFAKSPCTRLVSAS